MPGRFYASLASVYFPIALLSFSCISTFGEIPVAAKRRQSNGLLLKSEGKDRLKCNWWPYHCNTLRLYVS